MHTYKIGIPEIAISPLASKLKSSLYIGPTIWFISGGSNIKLSVAVMDRIDSDLANNLTIALADERFGSYNHPDSNWRQLLDAGFDIKTARIIEPLQPNNISLEETVRNYEQLIATALEDTSEAIGQFGMGNDGHIAGILPNSAATDDITNTVFAYDSKPFTRITLTFNGIRKLSTAFLIAMGEDKHDQLDRLVNQDLPLKEQPAQIIKQVREAYLYNDQVEGPQQ